MNIFEKVAECVVKNSNSLQEAVDNLKEVFPNVDRTFIDTFFKDEDAFFRMNKRLNGIKESEDGRS